MAKYIDLTGQTFGYLTVLDKADSGGKKGTFWRCQCVCGNTHITDGSSLRRGKVHSCGCKLLKHDLTGQTFGYLTVLYRAPKGEIPRSGWVCQCVCGKIHITLGESLRSGKIRSCGCQRHTKKLEGRKFGLLTAVKKSDKKSGRFTLWECLCDCGNTTYVRTDSLLEGKQVSCGCLRKEKSVANLSGDVAEKVGMVDGTKQSSLLSKKLPKNNKSGRRGVCWNERENCWRAYIGFQGAKYALGRFSKLEEAIAAREAAEKKLFDPYLREKGLIE